MASLDLKDAFLTIAIHASCFKYLCFDFDSVCYCFIALVFGISCSPRVFTKLLKVLLYITLDIVNRCRSLLESLGLIVKESKVFLSQHRLYPMLVSYGTLLTIQLQSHLIKFLLLKICAHLISLTQFLYGYWKGP